MRPTFKQFEAMLTTMDVLQGNTIAMFNNIPRQLGLGVFAYEYDALVNTRVRFNENGTVDEWQDLPDDTEPTEEPQTFPSIWAWIDMSVQSMEEPNAAFTD